jgi:hypothetical protein
MSQKELKDVLLKVVDECIAKGPGYTQESVVLREVVDRLNLHENLVEQQQLLTVWHNLFREGELSWGYDVDNPNAPFFHRSHLLEAAVK